MQHKIRVVVFLGFLLILGILLLNSVGPEKNNSVRAYMQPPGVNQAPPAAPGAASHFPGAPHAAVAGNAQPSTIPVLLDHETLWNAPVTEPAFEAFRQWSLNYTRAATPAQRQALSAEGVALAQRRLQAMATLIQTNPKRALELSVPETLRSQLPSEITALLEKPVNAVGDYAVVCVMALPGREAIHMIRAATLEGSQYLVFAYGKALDYVTHQGMAMNGISIPASAAAALPDDPIGLKPAHLMALDPQPGRWIGESEKAAIGVGAEICAATGEAIDNLATAATVEQGGELYWFASPTLGQEWALTNAAASNLNVPQTPSNLNTAESSYTEGRKRFLLMRVDFTNYAGEVMSTNRALTLMTDMGDFMAKISYYKHIIAPVGQGSDITPTMRMPQPVEYYDDGGLSRLYPDAKAVAEQQFGYVMGKYDFIFVCTGGKPAYTYAGLGYVGGVGYHLANGYWDVRTSAHEFGHNLGLWHANWWNTAGKSSIGSGTSDEYGDDFDTMGGSGGGIIHFSSFSKNKLGWIPNSDCPTASSSGLYRLHAHDNPEAPVGLRGVRLTRSGEDYWLEFRQLWTGNKAMMNGIALRWVSSDTKLLDMTPGSADNKSDHPLVIGNTFSDPDLKYFITPLGKANTYPESIDVMINIGNFPTNKPPQVMLQASSTSAVSGEQINFVATALDPNGDPLAYAWNFGDGDYSTDNNPVVSHGFSTTGEYTVQCTVSDMKGGAARETIVVRVDNPATFSISGHVLDTRNLPVAGIRVWVDSSHFSFTESDGSYQITRLAAGSYTVDASDPVKGSYSFVRPFFNNPVTVGPSYNNADLVASTGILNVYTPMIAKGSTWKYLDDGSDQGVSWIAPSFNDSTWSNGVAILGYNQGNETTTIRFGGDPNNKYITYYFRKTFTVADPAAYTNMLLEVLRDDGVIVYLNNTPVFSDNIATNGVTYLTQATSTVEPDAYLQKTITPSMLLQGNNVIAVEVHQCDPTSSDLNFDLALSALNVSNASVFNIIYISSPTLNQTLTSPTNVTVSAFAQSTGGGVNAVEFYGNGQLLGQDSVAPYSATWNNVPNGTNTVVSVALIGTSRMTSAPVAFMVSAPVFVHQPVSLTILPTGSVWKYLSAASAPPVNWNSPAYSDSAWPSGAAELGNGDSTDGRPEQTAINIGPAGARYPAIYFRNTFVVNDPSAITNLVLRLKRDDGAVVYVNGVEWLRDNMPTGAVSYTTWATNSAPDDGSGFGTFSISQNNLRVGTNVIAVEIHQNNATSSDLSFDLGLNALARTNRSRGLWLAAPEAGATFAYSAPIRLAAEAVAGGTLGIGKVEFYCDSAKVAESTNMPYEYIWASAPAGNHQVYAVAVDTDGAVLTSAVTSLTVSAPLSGSALISFGELWKYLDDGSDQGTNWCRSNFDDRGWSAGPGRLGYGGDGEATTLSYGTNSNERFITYYFRKSFIAGPPSNYRELKMRILRDDGAVVYLNGREVWRNNLKAGVVAFNSLAANTVGTADETTPLDVILNSTNLVAGTNVIAVEVHQVLVTSSDLGFDLSLIGVADAAVEQSVYLISPANLAKYSSPASVALSSYAVRTGESASRVEYYSGGIKLGESSLNAYAYTWNSVPIGSYAVTAVAYFSGGITVTSSPVSVTVTGPASVIRPVFDLLLSAGSSWQYWDNAQPVGEGWQTPGFTEPGWPYGVARFGWGLDGESTTLTDGRVTHYFRKWMTVTNPAQYSELTFQLARDDGAVVYLNGREVFRSNMPGGIIRSTTLASSTVNTPDETTYFESTIPLTGSGLLMGSNLVAVEMHQSSATSSDAGFDLQVLGVGTTEGRVILTSPAEGTSAVFGHPISLEAAAQGAVASAITRVSIYANSNKVADLFAPPWQYSLNDMAMGSYTLQATAIDALGNSLVSPPVKITVTPLLVSTQFISAGSVWSFNDKGLNLGNTWAQPGYDDSSWSAGAARLGYGDDGEITRVGYGPNSASKYITTYFRQKFVAPPGWVITNLICSLLRDDGAVVWLNGRELYRSNMGTGAITYTTLASSTVSTTAEQTYYTNVIAITNLMEGTNIIAVEIHQSVADSSDLAMDFQMDASGYVALAPEPATVSLASANAQAGQIQLTWPGNVTGWRLVSSTNLALPISLWSDVGGTVISTNGSKMFLVLPDGPSGFYRLIKR